MHPFVIFKFKQSITNGNFQKTFSLLETHQQFIDKYYCDEKGDSFMHLVFKAVFEHFRTLRTQIEEDQSITNFKNGIDSGFSVHEEELIKKMLELGFLCDSKNHVGMSPIDMLLTEEITHIEFKQFRARIVKLFEQRSGRLFHGRKYVYNFGLNRDGQHKRADIPDKWAKLDDADHANLTLHQRLAIYDMFFAYTRGISNYFNIVLANIGFVLSRNNGPRYFHTIPIVDPEFLAIGEESTRQINKNKHSEDCLFAYLQRPGKVELIIANLCRELELRSCQHNTKVYSLVLDIHSTEEVCLECEKILYELQDYTGDFLVEMKAELESKGFTTLKNKMFQLYIRASCFYKTDSGADLFDNHNNKYPWPELYQSYNHNIKNHANLTMLHLPPHDGESPKYGSKFFPSISKAAYPGRSLNNDILQSMLPNGYTNIMAQTAFVSGGPKNSIEWKYWFNQFSKPGNLIEIKRNLLSTILNKYTGRTLGLINMHKES